MFSFATQHSLIMNSFGWYLRLVAALFIGLGLVMRYNFGLETFELRWVESGFFNWLYVPIAIRLVALFEVLVMLTLITARISKKSLLVICSSLILIYAIDLTMSSNNSITSSFPYFFFYTPMVSWMGLFTLSVTVLLFTLQKNSHPPFVIKKWLFVSLQILLWVGVFFMNHITLDQFKPKTQLYQVGVSQWEQFDLALQEQNSSFLEKEQYLVAFFSTHCEVCHWNAMKLQAASDYYGKNKQLLLVFFEPSEDITFFLDATKIKAPYIELPPAVVANLVGDGFPTFVEFKKGKVDQEFSPNDLNYWELHRIFSQFQ
jgi:hypothetical protein